MRTSRGGRVGGVLGHLIRIPGLIVFFPPANPPLEPSAVHRARGQPIGYMTPLNYLVGDMLVW